MTSDRHRQLRRVRRVARLRHDRSGVDASNLLGGGLSFLHSVFDAEAPSTTSGLPLAPLTRKRRSTAHYAISSIDVWGRIADRSCLGALGWQAGTAIQPFAMGDVVAVVPDDGATSAITRQGHLRLPASTRRACQFDPGDRLLIMAIPHQSLLVVHTMAAVDAMVDCYYAWLKARRTQ